MAKKVKGKWVFRTDDDWKIIEESIRKMQESLEKAMRKLKGD